jgi:hypothetical protein
MKLKMPGVLGRLREFRLEGGMTGWFWNGYTLVLIPLGFVPVLVLLLEVRATGQVWMGTVLECAWCTALVASIAVASRDAVKAGEAPGRVRRKDIWKDRPPSPPPRRSLS